MRIQHYCYTRAKFLDYCVFSEPDNMPKYASKEIQAKALSIMDALDSKLNIPKWILVKTHDYIFWGTCCLNRILSDEYNCDYSGTSVSGMFAVVITEYSENEVMLPYDIKYFRKLYEQEVSMFWNQNEAHKNNIHEFISGDFNYIRASCNNCRKLLNTDIFQCKSLGNLDKKEVVAAALTLDNVSLLIDNDNIEQATNRSGSFMNCLTQSVGTGLYSVKQQCPECKKYVSSFTQSGICPDCQKTDELKEIRIKQEEKNMVRQIKTDLDKVQKRISVLESKDKTISSQLKEQNRSIKILWIISGILLLLCMWLFKHSDLKFNLDSTQEIIKTNDPQGGYYINVDSDRINIPSNGGENLIIK